MVGEVEGKTLRWRRSAREEGTGGIRQSRHHLKTLRLGRRNKRKGRK
jgi:hypothetical protein